jgi:hypothetical protein
VHPAREVAILKIRISIILLSLSAGMLYAGGKKSTLPTYILNARTVLVLIDPDAQTSMTSPLANKQAQDDVEKAFMRWGRLQPVLDPSNADLVVTVRKGSDHPVQPTVGGVPTNDRPVIVQQTGNQTRVGGQVQTPGTTQNPAPGAGPGMEVAPSEDTFAVYQGHVDSPLERSAAWRCVRKGALNSPSVPAVDDFRKAIEEAEKQQKKKP